MNSPASESDRYSAQLESCLQCYQTFRLVTDLGLFEIDEEGRSASPLHDGTFKEEAVKATLSKLHGAYQQFRSVYADEEPLVTHLGAHIDHVGQIGDSEKEADNLTKINGLLGRLYGRLRQKGELFPQIREDIVVQFARTPQAIYEPG